MSGAKSESTDKPEELSLDSLVWAMVSVFIVGLGTIIGLMAVMKNVVGFNSGIILAVTILSFLLMLAVEGVLIWLLLARKRSLRQADDTKLLKEQTTTELGAAQPRLIPEPVPSVTEQAARAFEAIPIERKSR